MTQERAKYHQETRKNAKEMVLSGGFERISVLRILESSCTTFVPQITQTIDY